MCADCGLPPELVERAREGAAASVKKRREDISTKLTVLNAVVTVGPAADDAQKIVAELRKEIDFLADMLVVAVTGIPREPSAEERARS